MQPSTLPRTWSIAFATAVELYVVVMSKWHETAGSGSTTESDAEVGWNGLLWLHVGGAFAGEPAYAMSLSAARMWYGGKLTPDGSYEFDPGTPTRNVSTGADELMFAWLTSAMMLFGFSQS